MHTRSHTNVEQNGSSRRPQERLINSSDQDLFSAHAHTQQAREGRGARVCCYFSSSLSLSPFPFHVKWLGCGDQPRSQSSGAASQEGSDSYGDLFGVFSLSRDMKPSQEEVHLRGKLSPVLTVWLSSAMERYSCRGVASCADRRSGVGESEAPQMKAQRHFCLYTC